MHSEPYRPDINIYVDGVKYLSANIDSAITDGELTFGGALTVDVATLFAAQLSSGSIDPDFTYDTNAVEATLGKRG
jgi:preprotein translocase subunit SecD